MTSWKCRFTGQLLLERSLFNKGTAFTPDERRELGLLGLLPPHQETLDQQVTLRLRGLPGEDDRPRAAHLPPPAPGQQRDAVLPPAARPPRRDDADHLHADRGPGLRAVQPHHPPPARAVHRLPRARRHRHDPRQRRLAAGRGDRRDRRRAHPRPGRPGRRRHGHPDRQAVALHRLRRHPPRHDPADPARRRHQQPRTARRPALHRLAARADHRRGVRRLRRRVRPGRQADVSRACCSSGRTSPSTTPTACSSATATSSARSTTTSRARPP